MTSVLTILPHDTPFQLTPFILKVNISPRERNALNLGEIIKWNGRSETELTV